MGQRRSSNQRDENYIGILYTYVHADTKLNIEYRKLNVVERKKERERGRERERKRKREEESERKRERKRARDREGE